MNNIAFIFARGGSKSLPEKNTKLFNGIPLIAHTIESAINSDLFDHVIVSTEDDEIAEISQLNNYRIIIDYVNLSLQNKLRNKFKNNDNQPIKNLTALLKKNYDPQNLFSSGKFI